MGFIARALSERKSVSVERIWDAVLNAGLRSNAGPLVTRDNAWRVSTAFACGRVLSQGTAQVPFKLHRKVELGGLTQITDAKEHPLYDTLTCQPNEWQSSFEFRELVGIHLAFAGNAYAWKNFQRGGYRELILFDPTRVKAVMSDTYDLSYEVTGTDGQKVPFPKEAIWHIRGPGWNGVSGWDTLIMAREALGLSMALEESHARMHNNAVRPSGVYSIEGTLDDKSHKQLEAWINKHAGAGATGKPLILDHGATWTPQSWNGVDAEHVATRRLQIEELCRFWGVLPIMVMSSDKAQTYASAEQMFLAHVVHTMGPWWARIEQSANVQLLSQEERKAGYYFKFSAAGLLRGAMKDQGDFFTKMLGGGGARQVLTQDEVREMLELNPLGGDAAKLHEPVGAPNNQPDPGSND